MSYLLLLLLLFEFEGILSSLLLILLFFVYINSSQLHLKFELFKSIFLIDLNVYIFCIALK